MATVATKKRVLFTQKDVLFFPKSFFVQKVADFVLERKIVWNGRHYLFQGAKGFFVDLSNPEAPTYLSERGAISAVRKLMQLRIEVTAGCLEPFVSVRTLRTRVALASRGAKRLALAFQACANASPFWIWNGSTKSF